MIPLDREALDRATPGDGAHQPVVATLAGDLGAGHVAHVSTMLAGIDPQADVVLDLGHVTFVGPDVVSLLVGAARRRRESGARLVLADPPWIVSRDLTGRGLDALLPVASTVNEAYAWASNRARE